jgi:hypothetical protein
MVCAIPPNPLKLCLMNATQQPIPRARSANPFWSAKIALKYGSIADRQKLLHPCKIEAIS